MKKFAIGFVGAALLLAFAFLTWKTADLAGSVDDLKNENENLSAELVALNDRAEQLESDLAAADIEGMQALLEGLPKSWREIEDQFVSTNRDVSNLESEVESLSSKLSTMERDAARDALFRR